MTKGEFTNICDISTEALRVYGFARLDDDLPDWMLQVSYINRTTVIRLSYENRGLEVSTRLYPTPEISGYSPDFNRFFLSLDLSSIRTSVHHETKLADLSSSMDTGLIKGVDRVIASAVSDVIEYGSDVLHGDFERFASLVGPAGLHKIPAYSVTPCELEISVSTLRFIGRYSSLVLGGLRPSYKLGININPDKRTISGSISDIGLGGDALLEGSITEGGLQFNAEYLIPSSSEAACHSHFVGHFYEDGRTIRGYWTILDGTFAGISGCWKAVLESSGLYRDEGFEWPPKKVIRRLKGQNGSVEYV